MRLGSNIQEMFHIEPNARIFSLGYKHRLEVYTNLRIKELKKEEDLRSAL